MCFPHFYFTLSESSSHRDAALFFKLVADGARDSSQRFQGTPNTSNSFPTNGRVVSLLFVLLTDIIVLTLLELWLE